MEKLSEDVLNNIFIRLPAKQLVQMRRVCKPWNAFLSESYFIKSHLNHSIRNKHNNEIVLFFNPALFGYPRRIPDSEHVLPYAAYDLSKSPIIQLNDHVKLPFNFPQSALNEYGGHVIGSVNGLICFYVGYHYRDVQGIYIWNPSLSVVTTLPPFSDQEELTDPSAHVEGYRYEFSFGFGFDPKTDDYKVIKLTEDRFCDELDRVKVEVYSMKKASWEFIVDKFPSYVDIELFAWFVDDHDGHLHCLGYFRNEVDDIERIVVFDLGMNSFHHILLPDSISNDDERRHNLLGMLGGKFCVVSYTRDDGKFEVWVKNEYGVSRDSWVKSHVLSKFKSKACGFISAFRFTLNNKLLFCDNSKGLLGWYDQETDKVTHFGSHTSGVDGVVPYVESLVWYAAPTT